MGDFLSFLVKHWVKYSMLVLMRGIASVYSVESFWRREVFNSLLPKLHASLEGSLFYCLRTSEERADMTASVMFVLSSALVSMYI